MVIILLLTSILLFIVVRKALLIKQKPYSFESIVLYCFRELGIGAAIFAVGTLVAQIAQNTGFSLYVNIVTYALVAAFMIESAFVLHSYYNSLPGILRARANFPKIGSIPTPITSEDQVINSVMKHPGIIEFRKRMELVNQKIGIMLDEENDYWVVRVYEDHPTHIATYGFFRIDKSTGNVTNISEY